MTAMKRGVFPVLISSAVLLGISGLVLTSGTDAVTSSAAERPDSAGPGLPVSSATLTARSSPATSSAPAASSAAGSTPIAGSAPAKSSASAVRSNSAAKTSRKSAPGGRYYISMKNILQRPELPTGCEATALTIVLNHMGFSVDKRTIVNHYLPKTSRQYSLNRYFIGNPYSTHGLGCNAPVIVTTANRYLKDVKSTRHAVLMTGSTPDQLYAHVSQGTPVLCWATIGMLNTRVSATWKAADTGETVKFMLNEHCAVLVGYDTKKKTVTLNDPWKGIVTYSMALFETRYRQLGKQAVMIA